MRALPRLAITIALFTAPAHGQAPAAQPNVTSPAAFFPEPPGSDYYLANYTEYEAYLERLASQSDRIKLIDIGRTAEGRTQWMAIVSSPANLAQAEHYRTISERLARARGLNDNQARALAAEGKAIVWIDAGMHATETVTSQGQIQVLYRLLTQSDPETLRLLNDCIILYGHDNPDGMELVSNWYMRHADPKQREFETLPRLYQKYVGHDNNRDSFMAQMPETENVNRVLFRQWYPQIIYNQHQTGPDGMVVFVPPFRDPFNFNYDPLVISALSEVGATMHSNLIAEGKAGSGMRSAARYSTWHNGMERSVAYFHNSIGLLTEIIGGPTPTTIPLVPLTQLPRGDEPMPVPPQPWHLQQSLDYQWTLNRAVIDYAARNRERLLFNAYRMGANSIERGSRDTWTSNPDRVAALESAAPVKRSGDGDNDGDEPRVGGPKKVDPSLYASVLQAPEARDPRGYVIPIDQDDTPSAIAFINALIKNGIEVERATASFAIAGKSYPAGTFVVRSAQAYRPFILDMFEAQHHPHDVDYPGGSPKAPYDITGYTLAYQMGIRFDRILDGFDGPFTPVSDLARVPPGSIQGSGRAGWIVSHRSNNSFILTNRLLKAGVRPAWLTQSGEISGRPLEPGAIWIPYSAAAERILQKGTVELGIDAFATDAVPATPMLKLRPVRIGLVDRYGGVIAAGWTRWLLEQFEFPYTIVYPKRLDAGGLERDFDVLLLADGTLPGDGGAWGSARPGRQPKPDDTPAEWCSALGNLTDDVTVPALKAFVRDGGTVAAIGSSTRLSALFGVPLAPALAQRKEGKLEQLPTSSFFIPGSILRVRVDNRQPLAYGMPGEADLFFNRSQTFVPAPGEGSAVRAAWFEGRNVLRSGWAIGQEKLAGTTAIADVTLGKGKLLLMGPEVAQRAQSYGTFKFLFNALLYGPAARQN